MAVDPELLDLTYLTLKERRCLLTVIDADKVLRASLLKEDGVKLKKTNKRLSKGNRSRAALKLIQAKLDEDHNKGYELLHRSLRAAEVSPRHGEILKDKVGSTDTVDHEYFYDITGQVLVGVYYRNKHLHVHIDRASGLAAADSNGYSNPYIKTYLLPDKDRHTKQKTSVKKKTLNPHYNEILKYKLSESALVSHSLLLSVWNCEKSAAHQFLGEVHLPLSSLNLVDTTDQWYHLQDQSIQGMPVERQSAVHISEVQKYLPKQVYGRSHPFSAASTDSRPPAMVGGRHRASAPAVTPGVQRFRKLQAEGSWQLTQIPDTPSLSYDSYPHVGDKVVEPSASHYTQYESQDGATYIATESIAVRTHAEEVPGEPKIHISHVKVHNEHQNSPMRYPLARLKQAEGLSLGGSLSSFGSLGSVYSEAGGKGDYDITGEVLVGVYYENNELRVHVDRARGLAAANSKGYSNPYIKTYLLPDKAKHTKQKTAVKKKTLDPVYNETFSYTLSKSQLSFCSVWLSVWDWDRFGRNQFLGEIHLPLSSLDLSLTSSLWYPLQDKDGTAAGELDAFYRGDLRIGLKYMPSDTYRDVGTLTIDVKQAKDLPAVDNYGTNSVVKLYLLPNRKSSGKRKTEVVKQDLNPVWEEKFTFEEINTVELSRERVLEVSVWNQDETSGDHTFIGGLRLGPAPGSAAKHKDWMDSIGDEVTHWEDMLAHPREWVEQWHTLRTTMNPRPMDVLVSASDDGSITPSSVLMEENRTFSTTVDVEFIPSHVDVYEPAVEQFNSPERRSRHQPAQFESSNLLGLKRAGSITSLGSMTSIYSEAGGKGDYDITGQVLMGVYYKNSKLHVHIDRASGLAAADSNGYSNPYVKTYLLPDKAKRTKQKTGVKKKTIDPVYDETLTYNISESELGSRILWVSLWDWDRFGRNQFLGEVHLPLSSIKLNTEGNDEWYFLQDKDQESAGDDLYRGQLKIAMLFSQGSTSKKSQGQGTLQVSIDQAKDYQEPVDSFVKLYLLPDKSSKGKRKTKIIKSSLKPSWEETFKFEGIKLDELSFERALEVTVWNFHKRSGNVFIGGLRLGPAPGSGAKHKDWMDSIGDEVTHWENMLAYPGEWVEQWHTLRTTMNPRDILQY